MRCWPGCVLRWLGMHTGHTAYPLSWIMTILSACFQPQYRTKVPYSHGRENSFQTPKTFELVAIKFKIKNAQQHQQRKILIFTVQPLSSNRIALSYQVTESPLNKKNVYRSSRLAFVQDQIARKIREALDLPAFSWTPNIQNHNQSYMVTIIIWSSST